MPTSLPSRSVPRGGLVGSRSRPPGKDNKLASLNIDTGECNEVPLPSRLRFGEWS